MKQGFMVMPFSNEGAKLCYEHSVKPICKEFGIQLLRADEVFGVNPIADDIARMINQAAVVVVDITDNNPNVFYELGLAHATKKALTIVINGTGFDKVPFDIKHIRIIKYEDSIVGKSNFDKALRETLAAISRAPVFYQAEFDVYTSLITCDSKMKANVLMGVLYLNDRSVSLTEERAVMLMRSGQPETFGTVTGALLVEDGYLPALGLTVVEQNAVQLSQKGRALAEHWGALGYEIRTDTVDNQM